MKELLFATQNASKVKRFSAGLFSRGIKLISLAERNLEVDINEDGKTAIENALIKARAYSKLVSIPVLAMDDSLYLEGVPDNLQPGLYVRRVNGKRLTDEEMIDYYSNLAARYGKNGKLTCKWIYGMAVINNGIESTYTWSKTEFYMVAKRTDKINPGYPLNSISINKKLGKYFTDITEDDKKLIEEDESHVIDFIESKINI